MRLSPLYLLFLGSGCAPEAELIPAAPFGPSEPYEERQPVAAACLTEITTTSSQKIRGITVSVSSNRGVVSTYATWHTIAGYWAGSGGAESVTYTFSSPVSGIKTNFNATSPGEYLDFKINGVDYPVTAGMLTTPFDTSIPVQINGGDLWTSVDDASGTVIFPATNVSSFTFSNLYNNQGGTAGTVFDVFADFCNGSNNDADGDGHSTIASGGDDCDDSNAAIYPGATELCNGIDDDCDGSVDDGLVVNTWYPDRDGDSYGDAQSALSSCTTPSGYILDGSDCDDYNATAHPGGTEVPYDGVDQDCDGSDWIDVDGDGYASDVVGGPDCWDTNPDVHPGIQETVDGVDEDCNSLVDDTTTAYDDDGDGYAEDAGDCDDSTSNIGPGTAETVDGVDQDCDGLIDDGTVAYDDDGDGASENDGDCNDADATVGNGAVEVAGNGMDDDCDGIVDGGPQDLDGDGYATSAGDCDDNNANIHPGRAELEDGIDNNCDGRIDEGTAAYDDDGDGASENAGDCDDSNAGVSPTGTETADGRDEDCDEVVDEGTVAYDDDGDGFSENGGDCDDANAAINPGAPDQLDGVDNDCDTQIDEGLADNDQDGVTEADGDCNDNNGWMNPLQAEVCDELDNDCNGQIDDGDVCNLDGDDPKVEPETCGCDGGGGSGVVALVLGALALRRRKTL